jgi:hypothetical protein
MYRMRMGIASAERTSAAGARRLIENFIHRFRGFSQKKISASAGICDICGE